MLQLKLIMDMINNIASVNSAADFDNCGLLVGSKDDEIERILIALDVSSNVIDEAIKNKCNLIITHHPLIFKAEKTVTDETYQGKLLLKLIKAGISLYSIHTPFDAASGGCNDVLCNIFGLNNVTGIDLISCVNGNNYYCGRVGDLCANVEELVDIAKKRLLCNSIRTINGNRNIKRIAICSGSGGSCIENAIKANADCFITGELSYHDAQKIKEAGMSAIICGHYQTENIAMDALFGYLQDSINMLQYKVELIRSEIITDPFD